jgi:hypothetical protein
LIIYLSLGIESLAEHLIILFAPNAFHVMHVYLSI